MPHISDCSSAPDPKPSRRRRDSVVHLGKVQQEIELVDGRLNGNQYSQESTYISHCLVYPSVVKYSSHYGRNTSKFGNFIVKSMFSLLELGSRDFPMKTCHVLYANLKVMDCR